MVPPHEFCFEIGGSLGEGYQFCFEISKGWVWLQLYDHVSGLEVNGQGGELRGEGH